MKTIPKTAITKISISIMALLSLLSASGCGGGGNSVSLSPSDISSNEVYRMDVSVDSQYYDQYAALTELETTLNELDDSAFKDYESIIDSNSDHRDQLYRIIDQIEQSIYEENFSDASQIIEKKLIPRIDGCDGGKQENDLVMGCGYENRLYNLAVELLENTSSLDDNTKKFNNKRTASALSDSYIQDLLDTIDNLRQEIESYPDDAFRNPVLSSRAILLDIVLQAKTEIEESDIDSAKTIIQDQLYPLIDGGAGGDTTDDLISETFYSLPEYMVITGNVEKILIETILTEIHIDPTSLTIGLGDSASVNAICIYNYSEEIDCSSNVNWAVTNPEVILIDNSGNITAINTGAAVVSAELDGIISNSANIVVNLSAGFFDDFDDGSINPELWSDVFKGASILTEENGTLRIQADSYSFGELVPIHYFKIGSGEKVEISVEMDPEYSSGNYFVQGFGIFNPRTTGIAAGVSAGTNLSAPTIYMSSPRGYTSAQVASGKGEYRITYQNKEATLYFNGTFIGSIEADLEDEVLSLFMYGSAGSSSYIDIKFDNFATNLEFPGDYFISLENNTNPFGVDGSGYIEPGDSYTFKFHGDPHQNGIYGKILDADTFELIEGPFYMAQSSIPGTYTYEGIMPSSSASNIVFVGSNDEFYETVIYSRIISCKRSTLRTYVNSDADNFVPESFPEFLLPIEMRD